MPQDRFITNDHIIALEWGKVNDSSGVKYEVEVDKDASFTSPEFIDNKIKSCSVKTRKLDDGIYYWKVRAIDRAGNIGLWSQVQRFWCYTQPPYAKTFGQSVHLVNNWDAIDPTWPELKSFLNTDETDLRDYSIFSFPCGAFAEEVHNNAEAAGIKAAWVVVDFEDNTEHALNAFNTTDKGLVYVDCTSSYRSDIPYPSTVDINTGQIKDWKPDKLASYDKIAYVSVGKEYGLISLSQMISPTYDSYVTYLQQYNEYETEVDLYNDRAKAYIQMLGGRTIIYNPVEYTIIKTMHDELDNERIRLESIAKIFGIYKWEELGMVKNITIYW